jgi:phytanoyl-CoA hydroxylase
MGVENSKYAETFSQDGFLVVRKLYTPDEMLEWKKCVIGILEAEDGMSIPSGVRVWFAHKLDPFLMEGMRDDKVSPILLDILGPNVEFLSVKAVFKNKTTTFGSPWHQDWYYWKGSPKISVWIALDDATPENGCLKMIAGSHRKRFKVSQVKEETGFGWRIENEEFAGMPETTLAVNRGDVVFFHDQTLHSSYPNANGADRWSFISTYRDASARDESTVWEKPMVIHGESVNVNS